MGEPGARDIKIDKSAFSEEHIVGRERITTVVRIDRAPSIYETGVSKTTDVDGNVIKARGIAIQANCHASDTFGVFPANIFASLPTSDRDKLNNWQTLLQPGSVHALTSVFFSITHGTIWSITFYEPELVPVSREEYSYWMRYFDTHEDEQARVALNCHDDKCEKLAPERMIMLSKSQVIRGLQCHKSLWLHRHKPELRDEIDESQQALFASGTDVGRLAQQLFPGGVEFPYGELTLTEQLNRTSVAIATGVKTIYEATFKHDDVLVKTDILHYGLDGWWELYEVKSSTWLKDVYLDDIAVQYHVLAGAGIEPVSAFLVVLNRDYVRQGEIDVHQLFSKIDVTDLVLDKQPEVIAEIGRQKVMLAGEQPAIDIGPHCDNPYRCDFRGHCWAHVPQPSVFDLRDHGRPDAFALYRQGIVRLEDIPIDQLGWRQQLQVTGTLHQQDATDREAVREILAELVYPVSYLDFETTFMTPVPLYDGSRPYQQIPFQFSLHIQEEADGPARHICFLADAAEGDPRPAFIDALLHALPDSGSIVVYNRRFEVRILNRLMADFPNEAGLLTADLERIVDLMEPFRQKSVYLWPFEGSYSLKVVLPAMVPELSYDNLPVANGGDASTAWLTMLNSKDKQEVAKLRQELQDYCHLDTLAMVKLIEKLRKLVA